MTERMTWREIKEKYPDQWVGLVDVEFEEDNKSTIKTAIVKYTDKTADELGMLAIKGEKIIPKHTNPDGDFQLGMMEVMV